MAGDAEGGGHLLQPDDDGDADGEPLDDRERDVAHRAPGAGDGEPEQDDPGHQPDDEDPLAAVRRDDRHQDHGHRPGRAAHLEVAAAEDGRETPATTAVTSPAPAPSPDVIPKASASGSATTATVRPASEVAAGLAAHRRDVAAVGEQGPRPQQAGPQRCTRPGVRAVAPGTWGGAVTVWEPGGARA